MSPEDRNEVLVSPEGSREEDKKAKKADLVKRLYLLLRWVGGDREELGKQLSKLEKQIEELKKDEGKPGEIRKLRAVLSQLKRRLAAEEESVLAKGREISEALVSDDEERKALALKELRKLIDEVGEERVKEIMGDEWVEKLGKDEWDSFDEMKVESNLDGEETKQAEEEWELYQHVKGVSKKLDEAELENVQSLAVGLNKEVGKKSVLSKKELEGIGDAGVRKALELLSEGEDGLVPLELLMDELESLPAEERDERLMRLGVYLEAMSDRLDGFVLEGVLEGIRGDFEGVVKVKLFENTVEFYGSGEARLRQFLRVMKEVDDVDELPGERVLQELLNLNKSEAKSKWKEMKERFEASRSVWGVVEKQKLYLKAKVERFGGRGRGGEVPMDEELGERFPFSQEEWMRMSDEERVAFEEWWRKELSPEERRKLLWSRRRLQGMDDFGEEWSGGMGGLEAFGRRSGVMMDSEVYRRFAREAERMGEETRRKRALELMKRIMNTGETSRAEANRELVWRLHALLGAMEDAELRDMIVVKLLWQDIRLSISGVATTEDLARMGRWTWYEAYDGLLDMEIDLESVVGLRGKKIGVREVIMALESKPSGSSDIWLGRILGAKTPSKVELAQRQLMLALSMEKAGFSYSFDAEGRLVFSGEGAEKVLDRLERKFGLEEGGNKLIDSLPRTGLRGEEDVFGEGEFEWMVGSAISFEHLTLRSVALEGGREWRLLPNDLRKTHGYGQMEYMLKVDPRFSMFAEVFDLQFRSLPGWKFKNFLNVFEEKLEAEGMSKRERKKFLKFLREVSLTDELSPELRRLDKMREMLDDEGFRERMKSRLGEEFNWQAVFKAMGIDGFEEGDWEEGWRMFRDNYSWIRVVNFTSLKHTDKADFWKYALAAREAFGSIDVAMGARVTPGLISQAVDIIIGKVGLGNKIGRRWGKEASAIYLDQSGNGWRLNRVVYRKSSGEMGLEQWRWRDEEGQVMVREKERAEKMGYELGEDGFVYDKLGRRVFRQEIRVLGKTEFDEWGMAGLTFDHRLKMIDKWNRDGVLTKRQKNLMKWGLRMSMWLGVEIERMPDSYLELPVLVLNRLVRNPLTIFGLPYYLLRGFYYDVLMNDFVDEIMAASKPLWDWFNQALEQQVGGR